MIVSITTAIIRAILRLYPARFRERFGEDVVASVGGELERARRQRFGASIGCAAAAIGMP